MKKFILYILFAACLLLSACSQFEAADRFSASAPSAEPSETPVITHTPIPQTETTTEDGVEMPDEYMAKEYMAEEIAAAEACRVQTKDAEYYLDTSKYMLYDYNMEFPLYSRQNDSNECDYLGTTGYSFQLCGSYIYIKSDIYWEDYPVGEITRIVNLKTRSITPFGYNVDIFIPDDGDSVYYTIDAEGSIYKADPSLAHPKKYTIEIPETSCVKKEYSESGCLCEDIATTGVDDGWIYFYYDAFEYEGPGIYEGNYRIRTNGSGLEKTDEGHFYDK